LPKKGQTESPKAGITGNVRFEYTIIERLYSSMPYDCILLLHSLPLHVSSAQSL